MLNLPLTFSQRAAAPNTPRPWLLVLLHDVARNEHDLLPQVTAFPERFHLLSLRAPHRIGPGSHAWFDFSIPPGANPVINVEQEAHSRALIEQSIVAAGLYLGISPEHVVVAGFGQGGIMALSLLLTRPEFMHAAIVWHGRLLPEVLPEMQSEREAFQGRQLWVSHGTHDGVVPAAHAQTIRHHVENTPIHTTFRQFAVGHELHSSEVTATVSWVEELATARTFFGATAGLNKDR